MLLGGLVGGRERTRQGKARQRAGQGDNKKSPSRLVRSGPVTSHNVDAIQAEAGVEGARPLWKSKSAQAGDTGWDGRALGGRRGQEECVECAVCGTHLSGHRGGDAVGAMDCDPEESGCPGGWYVCTWSPYTRSQGPYLPKQLRYGGAP